MDRAGAQGQTVAEVLRPERCERHRLARGSQIAFRYVAPLLRLYFDVRIQRPRDLLSTPAGTRLIFAPTHQSILDPWLLMGAFDHHEWRRVAPIRALATQSFEGGFLARALPLVKLLYRISGVVVLPPRGHGLVALEAKVRGLIDALDCGEAVVIFPEGRIRKEAQPPVGQFAPGVVHVHRRTGAPVVPIAVWTGRGPGLRTRYSVRVGAPLHIPPELSLAAGAAWLRDRTVELYRAAERDGER